MALEGEDEAPAPLQSLLNEAGFLDPDPFGPAVTESESGIWERSETGLRRAFGERELKMKETCFREIGQWVSA